MVDIKELLKDVREALEAGRKVKLVYDNDADLNTVVAALREDDLPWMASTATQHGGGVVEVGAGIDVLHAVLGHVERASGGVKNIRIVPRTPSDVKAIEDCKAATGETTAAKALLAAARLYPAMKRKYDDVERERNTLRAHRDRVREAFRYILGDTGHDAHAEDA